jgi:hypothetical protein
VPEGFVLFPHPAAARVTRRVARARSGCFIMRSFNVVESSTYFWVDTGQALNGKEENAIDSTATNTVPCSAPSGTPALVRGIKSWVVWAKPDGALRHTERGRITEGGEVDDIGIEVRP